MRVFNKIILLTAVFSFLFHSVARSQDLSGNWKGKISLINEEINFLLQIKNQPNGYTAVAESPDQGVETLPVDTLFVQDGILRFAIQKMRLRFQGDIQNENRISGDFVQNGATYPLVLIRQGPHGDLDSARQVEIVPGIQIAKGEESDPDSLSTRQEVGVQKEDSPKKNAPLAFVSTDSILAHRLEGKEDKIRGVLKEEKIPGMAIVVTNSRGTIYRKSFGLGDLKSENPVQSNTLFPIGTATGPFTATVVGKMADEGILSLDSPVTQYLPLLKFASSELNSQVTVRDLITHRSGLPAPAGSPLSKEGAVDSLLAAIQGLQPVEGIRTKWQYNDYLYGVLGALIEEVSGKSWEENLKSYIFDPIGMAATRSLSSELPDSLNIATGYVLNEAGLQQPVPLRVLGAMAPASGLLSNAEDLSNWIQLWLASGRWDGKQVLSEKHMAEALLPQVIISAQTPESNASGIRFTNFGLGWFMDNYEGHYRVEYPGEIEGFASLVAFFPNDDLGVAILINQEGAKGPKLILDELFRTFFKEEDSVLQQTQEPMQKDSSLIEPFQGKEEIVSENQEPDSIQTGAVSIKDGLEDQKPEPTGKPFYKEYAGTYAFQGLVVLITYREEDIFITIPGQKEYKLIPKGEGNFDVDSIPEHRVIFQFSPDGEVDSLLLIQPDATFKANRI